VNKASRAPTPVREIVMLRFLRPLSAIVTSGLIAAAPPTWAQSGEELSPFGIWRNPKNTVHIELRPCGENACGVVVWASPKALADAREAGTEDLVGLQLFREMTRDKNGTWRGKVFVPDLNMTVSGRAEPIDETHLRARGCLIAGMLCKSQIWVRLS
jgi:uncharacterized protein (DUF2147 family)